MITASTLAYHPINRDEIPDALYESFERKGRSYGAFDEKRALYDDRMSLSSYTPSEIDFLEGASEEDLQEERRGNIGCSWGITAIDCMFLSGLTLCASSLLARQGEPFALECSMLEPSTLNMIADRLTIVGGAAALTGFVSGCVANFSRISNFVSMCCCRSNDYRQDTPTDYFER